MDEQVLFTGNCCYYNTKNKTKTIGEILLTTNKLYITSKRCFNRKYIKFIQYDSSKDLFRLTIEVTAGNSTVHFFSINPQSSTDDFKSAFSMC